MIPNPIPAEEYEFIFFILNVKCINIYHLIGDSLSRKFFFFYTFLLLLLLLLFSMFGPMLFMAAWLRCSMPSIYLHQAPRCGVLNCSKICNSDTGPKSVAEVQRAAGYIFLVVVVAVVVRL